MSAKRLNRTRLAFHHRLAGQRADVAQAEHGGAVGDHRDQVARGGVVVGEVGILGDLQAGRGDAGRVGERQVALRRQRLGGDDLDLTRPSRAVHDERIAVEIAHLAADRRFRACLPYAFTPDFTPLPIKSSAGLSFAASSAGVPCPCTCM